MKLFLTAIAYGIVTVMLFGNPFQPLALATVWSDRLGLPNWRVIAVLCVAASALILVPPLRSKITSTLRLPIFVILAVLLPTTIVGLYADSFRRRAVLSFGADEVQEHTFFTSIREAPEEFQFFLHTAVLKDCAAYAWSYRSLTFYKLPPNVEINVLPQRWITKCGLKRN